MNLSKNRKYSLGLILLISLFFIGSCSEQDSAVKDASQSSSETLQQDLSLSRELSNSNQIDSPWLEHIQAFSQGWLPAEQPIRVRFSHDVVTSDQIDQPQTALVEIQPKVDIEATFVSSNELLIKHKTKPQPGQIFSVAL
jgi:hypothetical protein